jgi:tetratricopeptide (TPR) repeat protein
MNPINDDNLIFISVPENMATVIGSFKIDPSILIPVEILSPIDKNTLDQLSWEMIISGMLKVLSSEVEHEHAAYYRNFILAVKPDLPEEFTSAGIIKAGNRDYDVAEDIFTALRGLEPLKAAHHINLALVYQDHALAYKQTGSSGLQEKYEEKALKSFKNAYELDSANAEVNYNYGIFLLGMNNYSKGAEYLKQFCNLTDDKKRRQSTEKLLAEIEARNLEDNLFKEAFDFIKMGQEDTGIEKITLFLKANPKVWNAWFILGWALRRKGTYDKALEAFEKALELGADIADAYNEAAICCMETGKLNKSRKLLEKALYIEPENIKIISNFGILALKENKKDEALSFFRTVIEFQPDDALALKYLEFLESKA